MQVTLTRVSKNVKETKFGNKLSVGLKIKETEVTDINGTKVAVNDRFLNGWFNEDFKFEPQEGDVIDILITTRDNYIDFKLPGVGKPPAPDMSAIVERIARLESVVYGTKENNKSEPEAVDPNDF